MMKNTSRGKRRDYAYNLMSWLEDAQRQCEELELWSGAGRFLGYWLALSCIVRTDASESLLCELAKTINVSIQHVLNKGGR